MAKSPTIKTTPEEPETSRVFVLTNGEKIRVNFDAVTVYKSTQKQSVTQIEIGYGDPETFLLDVSFDDFDAIYQSNRAAWREYWNARSESF